MYTLIEFTSESSTHDYDWQFFETDNTRKALYRFKIEHHDRLKINEITITSIKTLDKIQREEYVTQYWETHD